MCANLAPHHISTPALSSHIIFKSQWLASHVQPTAAYLAGATLHYIEDFRGQISHLTSPACHALSSLIIYHSQWLVSHLQHTAAYLAGATLSFMHHTCISVLIFGGLQAPSSASNCAGSHSCASLSYTAGCIPSRAHHALLCALCTHHFEPRSTIFRGFIPP